MALNAVESGESTDNYYAREYAKRTGETIAGEKVAKPKQRRQCSWCKGEHGVYAEEGYDHNRRTCPSRAKWRENQVVLAREAREGILERMKSTGFGVGTLIKMSQYDYFSDEEGVERFCHQIRLLMVTKIYWDLAHHRTNRASCISLQDVAMPKRSCSLINLPKFVEAGDAERWAASYYDEKYEIVSQAGVVSTVPEGWLEGVGAKVEEPY